MKLKISDTPRLSSVSNCHEELRPDFWKNLTLDDLNKSEWEALCDGCGQCCLFKFDHGNNDIAYTNVACRLLDCTTCQCKHYEKRTKIVNDCMVLDLELLTRIVNWMPPTCAYRLRFEDKQLFDWHYLNSGNHDAIHEAGISVKDRVIPEMDANLDRLEDYSMELPLI